MDDEVSTAPQAPLDYRRLVSAVDRVVASIAVDDEEAPLVQTLAAALTAALGPDLGIEGGRIYVRSGNDYRLWEAFGAAAPAAQGVRVPGDYEPLVRCFAQGSIYMRADDPALDPELEGRLGAAGAFAAIELGDRDFLVAFDLVPGHEKDRALFSLGLLRNSINQKLRQEQIEEVFREARRIQTSILPRAIPVFGDYEIAFRSVPLERVGGDFFDCISLSDKILGLAIADVSGHGLPAALQVRDIYMGLRMAAGREFKIVRTVERLNQIINLSTLTSRFVSMFYGEVEIDGTFIYVNAGHPPPFHLRADGSVRFLEEGGTVLGPLPQATYTRGYLTMRPGDALVFFTDGLTEAQRPAGFFPANEEREEYGVERLVQAARANRHHSAEAMLEAIFQDVAEYCAGAPAEDDRTAAVVRLPP